MPAIFVFEKRYAMTFKCFCNDGKGFSCWLLCFLQSLVDLFIIMSIDGDHFKIKGFKFLRIFFNVMTKHCFLALSKTVNVQYHHKVVKLFMCNKIGGFPYLSFC